MAVSRIAHYLCGSRASCWDALQSRSVVTVAVDDVFGRVDVLLLLLLLLVVTDDALMTRTVVVVADPLRAVADQTPRLQLVVVAVTTTMF